MQLVKQYVWMFALSIPAVLPAQRATVHRKTAPRTVPTPAPAPTHFVLGSGNSARFVVREQLMSLESPNDAIGVTTAISGGITVRPDGSIDPAGSRIVVLMDSLKTDKENRDKWIKSHTLRTDSFPTTAMTVQSIEGLPRPLPANGNFTGRLIGDLTIHGVTRRTSWDLTMVAHDGEYSGTATTHLKFEDFGMEQPRLMIVVSVVDDVKLEYNFHLVRQGH